MFRDSPTAHSELTHCFVLLLITSPTPSKNLHAPEEATDWIQRA